MVIAPEKGSIKISETYVPKAGTRLATLFNAPKTGKANPKIQSGHLGGGMMLFDFVMGNPDALAAFVVAESEQLIKEMEIKDVDLAKLIEAMGKWMKIYSGAGSETFDFDSEAGMSVNYLLAIDDEAAALGLLETFEEDMEPFFKLYADMGMPMKFEFEENVREHKGIKIHQLEMDIEMAEMPEDQRAQMEAMKLDDLKYDIAIFDGYMLYTVGTTKIETVIDRLKDSSATASPLKARSIYPSGGFYYLDFDMGKYATFVSSLIPGVGNPAMKQQMATLFQNVEPLTSAGFKADGRVMWSVNVPGELIAKYGQMAMMMQMQKMQQQPVPGGMPQGSPATMPPGIPAGIPIP